MLYASLHELVHHFFGFAVCGRFGTMTFNSFRTGCEGTFASRMTTLAGPVFTFAMMYVGWFLLARRASTSLQRQIGFAVVFAQLPLQRITGPLMRLNDEHSVAAHYFGDTTPTLWATFAAILAICLPPLVGAWRAIENRRRLAWFAFYLVLFPYLVWAGLRRSRVPAREARSAGREHDRHRPPVPPQRGCYRTGPPPDPPVVSAARRLDVGRTRPCPPPHPRTGCSSSTVPGCASSLATSRRTPTMRTTSPSPPP